MRKMIVLAAMTGLLAAGCTSHKGGGNESSTTGTGTMETPSETGTNGMGGPSNYPNQPGDQNAPSTEMQSGSDTNNQSGSNIKPESNTTPEPDSENESDSSGSESPAPQ